MADDSVVEVDDEKSKIVTQFFLDTCRLQPSKWHVDATSMCVGAVHPPDDNVKSDLIQLVTGSVAEFYIQPMSSCVGDIDIMHYFSHELAIPAGYPPPSRLPDEFFSRVKVYAIIDSEYPGYVYLVEYCLLTENTYFGNYHVAQYYTRPRYGWYRPYSTNEAEINGPAITVKSVYQQQQVYDTVGCKRCPMWPTQAADWPARRRNYDWPDSATIDYVVSNGCHLVSVAYRQCRQDEWMNTHQWRLSFSRAEIVLLNSWMPVQQIVYHMLRVFVKTERLTAITDSTERKIFCNYHIKTLMLWACELKPRSWWIVDLNVARICVALLYNLADWLRNKNCPHYFVNNCSLIDTSLQVEIIVRYLVSITESWLSTWFVNNYLQKCAQLCPGRVSRLFDDVSTSMKLQNAVSAVVEWRLNSALEDLWRVIDSAEFAISSYMYVYSFNVLDCNSWTYALAKIDSCLCVYFTAVAFLRVVYETKRTDGLSDEMTDLLATILGQFVGKRRSSNQLSSVLSLSQAVKLMKVVVNNSHSTVQLIEIELSKAYLYRALRCKDYDSDSIYCLAHVYLAVLYYATGHYQTATDHCTLVTRSQVHSQHSSHVVQGELLPKIDDNIDTVLGLAVFYQYVRTTALNQQQQAQNVSVFTTESFAHYLRIRCLSVTKCPYFTEMTSTDDVIDNDKSFITDLLRVKLVNMISRKCHHKPLMRNRKPERNANELDTSELVELLQQSAVEHLTTYRQLQAQKFGSVATIVTTDFEALCAYKRGNYQQCLQLSTQNVRTLLYGVRVTRISTIPEFVQLLDDEIVSLNALLLIIRSNCKIFTRYCLITQLTLSLYLMTQCQLKLHHSATSLAQTLDYIEVAQRKHPVDLTLDQLTLTVTKRKVMIYLASVM